MNSVELATNRDRSEPVCYHREMCRHDRPLTRPCYIGYWFFLATALAIVGCGNDQPTIQVSGRLMFDGSPVYPGSIILQNQDQKIYTANLRSDGRFSMKVASPGTYNASIQTHKLANLDKRSPGQTESTSERPAHREEMIPEKFKNANVFIPEKYAKIESSGLTFTIDETANDLGEIVLK